MTSKTISKSSKKSELVNHKGTWCVMSDTFCQEGYCHNCEILRQTICADCGKLQKQCVCEAR